MKMKHNTTYQNMWDAAKAIWKGKFIEQIEMRTGLKSISTDLKKLKKRRPK